MIGIALSMSGLSLAFMLFAINLNLRRIADALEAGSKGRAT